MFSQQPSSLGRQESLMHSERSVNSNGQNFLIQENMRLKEEIQDLRQVLVMNKVQIDILSRLGSPAKGAISAVNPNDKKLIDLVYNYRVAYEDLRGKVSGLRNLLQEKAEQNLILQQLNQQANVESRAMEQFYQKSMGTLQQTITVLEKKIQTCERDMKEYDGITGFVIKNRDIFAPTQQALEFRNHQLEWGAEIQLMRERIVNSKKTEENLIIANTILRNKVVSLQAKMAMPNRNLGEILDKSLKRLMVYFIETQKKILTGDDSDSSDQDDLELIAPQLHGLFPEKQIKKMKVTIPHLDLLKVRQAMINGNQKIQEQLRRRNHLSKDERLERLEIELQFTRRQLSKNIIELRDEKDKRRRYQRIAEEISNRNQILTESNQILNRKLKKCLREIDSNKQKVLAFLQNSTQEGGPDSYQGPSMLNELSFINRDFNPDATVSKMDLMGNIPKEARVKKPEKEQPIYLLNDPKLEFKIYMEMLQRDLQNNRKLDALKDGQLKVKRHEEGQEEPRGMKRSTSDPFLYFNERREAIMEVNQTKDLKQVQEGFRLEQTEFHVPQGMGLWRGHEDLDDVQI